MNETREPIDARETLAPTVRNRLEPALRFEADMAYRRRTLRLFEYLDPKDGDRVLDLGCGRGFHLQLLSKLFGARAAGLDLGFDDLRRAREDASSDRVLQGEAAALPFRDALFDKVLMTEVLEHLEEEISALSEVRRVLRPGGTLAISVPNSHYPFLWDPVNYLWTALGGRPIRKGPLVGIWTNHHRLYTPTSLVAVVRSAGFEVEQVEEATHSCFPFSHLLLYGVGKPLVDSKWVPASVKKNLGRVRVPSSEERVSIPMKVGLGALYLFDRLNARPRPKSKGSYVNVLVRARKP